MESDFINELLREAEEKEQKLSREFADLMLIEISQLEKQIQTNFEQAAKEREIIKNWALSRNSSLASRVEFLSKKLEVFTKDTGEKTINLPNGILKMHKKPDRIEIDDLELFLKNARPECPHDRSRCPNGQGHRPQHGRGRGVRSAGGPSSRIPAR